MKATSPKRQIRRTTITKKKEGRFFSMDLTHFDVDFIEEQERQIEEKLFDEVKKYGVLRTY